MNCSPGEPCDFEYEHPNHMGSKHGAISNDEKLIFVIFNAHGGPLGRKLISSDFNTKRITRREMSLARLRYTTQYDLDRHVIGPAVARGEVLAGVSIASTKSLRSIIVKYGDPNRPDQMRGVCIIDEVNEYDHEGHASLGVCSSYVKVSEPKRSIVKAAIAADLANKFSPLTSVTSIFSEGG